MIRAAIDLLPAWARDVLGLSSGYAMPFGGGTLLRALGAATERFVLRDAPPTLACKRMGLEAKHLYL